MTTSDSADSPTKLVSGIAIALFTCLFCFIALLLIRAVVDLPVWFSWLVFLASSTIFSISWYGNVRKQKSWTIIYRIFRNTPIFRSAYKPLRNFLSEGWRGVVAASLISAGLTLPFWLAYQPAGKAAAANADIPQRWLTFFSERPLLAAVPVLWPVVTAFCKKIDSLIMGDSGKSEIKMSGMLLEARMDTSHWVKAILVPFLHGSKDRTTQGTALIDKLVERLLLSFTIIVPEDVQIKVSVFSVKNGCVYADIGRQPQSYMGRTSLETLRNPKSSAMQAIESRKLVIISDLESEVAGGEESRYLICPENKAGGKGSLLCYPVVKKCDGRPVIYVICIQATSPMTFGEINRQFYERELGTYAADFEICDVLLETDAQTSA